LIRFFLLALSLFVYGSAWAGGDFTLSGRISIRQHENAYHGTLGWQHSAARDELVLTGPLGQGVAELKRDAGGVVLHMTNGERYEADTLDALAARFFGAPVPIAALPDWIRGIASNEAQLDEQKRPVRLVLPDWTVEWVRYGDDGRPQLLTLESEEVGVRLRIDSWTESNAEAGAR
jgi:outer membrane lipoprotein LolB